MTTWLTAPSPLGDLLLVSDGESLTHIRYLAVAPADRPLHPRSPAEAGGVLAVAADQLSEYFAGRRRSFDLPLRPAGTAFQREVWSAMTAIPFGATAGYGELAGRVGRPAASRAVGAACGRNPLPIVVPCHRVVGSDGSLTGYAGGLGIKRALLDLERRVPAGGAVVPALGVDALAG